MSDLFPHNGVCECADGEFWCSYCCSRMPRGADQTVFFNRIRPEPPLFLSRDEAREWAIKRGAEIRSPAWAGGAGEVIMTFKPEPPKLVDAAKIKHRALLSEYLVRLAQATNNAVGVSRDAPIMALGGARRSDGMARARHAR